MPNKEPISFHKSPLVKLEKPGVRKRTEPSAAALAPVEVGISGGGALTGEAGKKDGEQAVLSVHILPQHCFCMGHPGQMFAVLGFRRRVNPSPHPTSTQGPHSQAHTGVMMK